MKNRKFRQNKHFFQQIREFLFANLEEIAVVMNSEETILLLKIKNYLILYFGHGSPVEHCPRLVICVDYFYMFNMSCKFQHDAFWLPSFQARTTIFFAREIHTKIYTQRSVVMCLVKLISTPSPCGCSVSEIG